MRPRRSVTEQTQLITSILTDAGVMARCQVTATAIDGFTKSGERKSKRVRLGMEMQSLRSEIQRFAREISS